MKHLKMLGLAAIAALGLMASVGAGTASATTLSTDAAGTITYGVGTEIHESLKKGTSGIIEDTAGKVIGTVTEETIKRKMKTATGTWVGGEVESWTFGGASTTIDTLATGSIEMMQTSGDAATVISKGAQVTQQLFGVSCVYGTGEGTTLGTIKGGSESELPISAVFLKVSGGFLCPTSEVWTTTMVITSPHALHVVS